MALEIPDFETQMRGFDRNEVSDYIGRLHHEISVLQERNKSLEASKSKTLIDREQLAAEVTRLQNDVVRMTAEAENERQRLTAELAQLRSQFEQVAGPVDSVEGMSDRIARMMRIASEEARRTKELARQDAEALTTELREQLEAASHDRAAASAALAEFQASTHARRTKILEAATQEAEQILRIAHEERSRIAQEIEEAERSRREVYQRLAEDDERNRRAAQEALDEQIKLAWEEDERNRREAQQRLDQKMKAAWEQAEANIAKLDKEARLEASSLIANTKREAKLLRDRTQAEVEQLGRERAGIVTHLSEIRNWIDTAVGEARAAAGPAEASEAESEAPAHTGG
ncbi:hypothetical protein [Mycolicibacter hiberniae]|uniref:Uncharacterized protein n=1 Tax=Mycolicibacter hiberniae TaxID=29314 RepID=A0A7I7X4F5_9MYCO|nr:hypothetical protein [Mycolicibacter hiberniae]MCV7085251.1 hypothetical protein [Mycolicibacter hiberniae]ORV70480.1 hypothetical protein AWC09_10595 [Mycolicibacter hiberniae]BBZ23178.1 hypothetical protein MHIB_15960 [Mycolicibacter hiberniae]